MSCDQDGVSGRSAFQCHGVRGDVTSAAGKMYYPPIFAVDPPGPAPNEWGARMGYARTRKLCVAVACLGYLLVAGPPSGRRAKSRCSPSLRTRATSKACGGRAATIAPTASSTSRCRHSIAAGKAEWERHVAAEKAGTPIGDAPTRCYPHGIPRMMASPYPIQIIQTPGMLTMLHEVGHNIRYIYMDQQHPKKLKPSFLGHSIGHWEGDTLVIDTVGFNDRTRIDEEGIVHSDKLHMVERLRKIDNGNAIENLMTIEDPAYFTQPWQARRTYHLAARCPAGRICLRGEQPQRAQCPGLHGREVRLPMSSKSGFAAALLALATVLPATAAPSPTCSRSGSCRRPVWTLKTVEGKTPPLNAAGKALYERRLAARAAGKPIDDGVMSCLPHGYPRVLLSPYPFRIYQKPQFVAFVHELHHVHRVAYLDEDNEPVEALDPTYMGYPVAHYDGTAS